MTRAELELVIDQAQRALARRPARAQHASEWCPREWAIVVRQRVRENEERIARNQAHLARVRRVMWR